MTSGKRKCSWCNGYLWNWTQWPGVKSWISFFSISLCASSLRKSMINYFHSNYGKIVMLTRIFNLLWQTVLEKENSEFKPIKLYFKNKFMSYPAHVRAIR